MILLVAASSNVTASEGTDNALPRDEVRRNAMISVNVGNRAPQQFTWLPLDQAEVVSIISGGLGEKRSTQLTLREIIRLSQQEPAQDAGTKRHLALFQRETERLQKMLKGRGDVISNNRWFKSGFDMVMAGDGKRLHTLKITLRPVNTGKVEFDKSLAVLSDLLIAIYPDRPEVKKWPMETIMVAWDSYPQSRIGIEKSNGITVSAFGVPPDIVVFGVTARDACVPEHSKGNLFKRLLC